MKQNENVKLFVIGGPGSSGSSTIAKMLSTYLHIPRVYAGGIFREKAKKAGFNTIEEYIEYVSKHGYTVDNEIDTELVQLAEKGHILIESKVFAAIATNKGIECSAKIWLDASLDVRAKRALGKEKSNGFLLGFFRFLSIKKNLKKRFNIDRQKYWDLYRIYYEKPELYNDLVLDTSNINEEETFNLILKFLKDGGYIK